MTNQSSGSSTKSNFLHDTIYPYGMVIGGVLLFLGFPVLMALLMNGPETTLRFAKEYLLFLGYGIGIAFVVSLFVKLGGGKDLWGMYGIFIGLVMMIAIIGGSIRSCSMSEEQRILAARDEIAAWYDQNFRVAITALVSSHEAGPAELPQGFKPDGAAIVVGPDGMIANESYVLTGSSTAHRQEDVKYIVVVTFKGNVSTGYWKRKGSTLQFEGFASKYEFKIYRLQDRRVIVTQSFLSGNYSATESQDNLRMSVILKLEKFGFEVWMPDSVAFAW